MIIKKDNNIITIIKFFFISPTNDLSLYNSQINIKVRIQSTICKIHLKN